MSRALWSKLARRQFRLWRKNYNIRFDNILQIPRYFFRYNTPFTPPRGPSRGDRLLHLNTYTWSLPLEDWEHDSSVYVSCACTYVYIYNQYKKSVNTEQIRDALHLHSTPFYWVSLFDFGWKIKRRKKYQIIVCVVYNVGPTYI